MSPIWIAFLLCGVLGEKFFISEEIVLYREDDMNYFVNLEHVLNVPGKEWDHTCLMYQYFSWKNATQNYDTKYQFQIFIPDLHAPPQTVLEGEEPPWDKEHGGRIIATAKTLHLDGVFLVAKTLSGEGRIVNNTTEWFSNVSMEVMGIRYSGDQNGGYNFSVESLARTVWRDQQREPVFNVNGSLVGYREEANLTSKVLSRIGAQPLGICRSSSGVFVLVESDQSVKLLFYTLEKLDFVFKILLRPSLDTDSTLNPSVGQLVVEPEYGDVWVAISVDRNHKAGFEALHNVTLPFPKEAESIGVLLGFDGNGTLLLLESINISGCSNYELYSIDVVKRNRIAVGGNCNTSEGNQVPIIFYASLKEENGTVAVASRLRTEMPLDKMASIYSMVWMNEKELLTAGALGYMELDTGLMVEAGDAFLAVFNVETGEKVGFDRWGGARNDEAHDVHKVRVQNANNTGVITYYCLATLNAPLSDDVDKTMDAALYKITITEVPPKTHWVVLVVVLSIVFSFILLGGIGILIWRKKRSSETRYLLAAHPKTRLYSKVLFRKRNSKNTADRDPLLGSSKL